MPQWLHDGLILGYVLLVIISVIYAIVIIDDLCDLTHDSKHIDLAPATILVMIGSLCFLCIPWAIFIHIYYKLTLAEYEEKQKEREERKRIEAIEEEQRREREYREFIQYIEETWKRETQ